MKAADSYSQGDRAARWAQTLGNGIVTIMVAVGASAFYSTLINLPVLMIVDVTTEPQTIQRAWAVIAGLCLPLVPAMLFTLRRFGSLAVVSFAVGYLLFWTWDSTYLRGTLFGFGCR